MAKQDVEFDTYMVATTRVMHKTGILLTTKDKQGKPNTMAIGWGTIGVIWGKPIFVVFVRPSRYTYGLLEDAEEFTVNVMPPEMSEVVEYCGTKSGRDTDKFADKHLTPAPAKAITTPILDHALIAYECKVVHKNDVVPDELADDIKGSAYPSGDYHRIYFGEILHVQAEPNAAERLAPK